MQYGINNLKNSSNLIAKQTKELISSNQIQNQINLDLIQKLKNQV